MSSDTDSEIEIDPLSLEDPFAARGMTVYYLLKAIDAAKDEDVKKEGLAIARTLRLSIKAPAGELTVIK